MKTSMATLTEFVWIWDKYQNLTLPKHHCQMCYFLSKVWASKTKHALVMAFRDSGKSTIVGVFWAWLLYSNPDVRILIMSADFELAKKIDQKYVPEIRFVYDDTLERADRIEELLNNIEL